MMHLRSLTPRPGLGVGPDWDWTGTDWTGHEYLFPVSDLIYLLATTVFYIFTPSISLRV